MGLWIAKEIALISAISAQCMNVTDRQIYRPRNRNMLCNWQVLHENYTTLNNLAAATLLTSSITLGSNSLKTFSLQKITSTTNEYRLTSRATSLAELTDYSYQLQKRRSILNRRLENKNNYDGVCVVIRTCSTDVTAWVWSPCNAVDTGSVIVQTCHRRTWHSHIQYYHLHYNN